MRYDFMRKLAGLPEDFPVHLGTEVQPTSLFAVVPAKLIWSKEPLSKRILAVLTRRWNPDPRTINDVALEIFRREIFGGPDDFGDELMKLMKTHGSNLWDFSALTSEDLKRSEALEVYSMINMIRLGSAESNPSINLGLKLCTPEMCVLALPMVIKIPVISFKWFLNIHFRYAVHQIRFAKHPYANELIAFLYDTLFLQQKTAIAISEYVRLAAFTGQNKAEAVMINAEVNAIMQADLVFTYLKSTIEKSMTILAYTHGITNLDGKKNHKARLVALEQGLPKIVMGTPYGQFVLRMIQSESIEDINSYRSGLLHKKGIADLQPHNYVNVDPIDAPFIKIFSVLIEQHAKNTVVLLCTLALLADELVRLKPLGPELFGEEVEDEFRDDRD
jgi:hypothetical protein